jgi:hypothetical protein
MGIYMAAFGMLQLVVWWIFTDVPVHVAAFIMEAVSFSKTSVNKIFARLHGATSHKADILKLNYTSSLHFRLQVLVHSSQIAILS